jgi:hypothetical protein
VGRPYNYFGIVQIPFEQHSALPMSNNSTVVQKDAPPGRLYDLLEIDDTAQLQNNCPVSNNPRISTATIRINIFYKTS